MAELASFPASHFVQEVAPAVELILPPSQTTHVVLSADLYCPAGQGSEKIGLVSGEWNDEILIVLFAYRL